MSRASLWMAAASEIAAHLCESAVEHDGRCTWLGTAQQAGEDDDLEFSYGPVGADLYSGTAGIALFLAEVAGQTGDGRCAERAAQGIRQSLRHVAARPPLESDSYFAGTVGVAYAAVRTARALGRPELLAAATSRLTDDAFARSPAASAGHDIIAGGAGAIPALLTLSDWVSLPALRGRAVALGDRLIAAAHVHGDGRLSWRDAASEADVVIDLTGFSHGAAGVGWALLELHAATGEPRFREAAVGAFQYERRWFRAAEDNWPDFRGITSPDDPVDCGVAWCHGAPGIGLSRLRLVREGDRVARHEADAALRASVAFVQRSARDPYADWSLCHGLAGVCDAITVVASALDRPASQQVARDVALDVASAAAERLKGAPADWPCGVARGSNPSLMLGLAGIGYFFLRLAVPALPSALLPGARGNLRMAESAK